MKNPEKKSRIIPSRGDFCLLTGNLDGLGVVKIQSAGCMNILTVSQKPEYSDAEINYTIARLELQKEKVCSEIDAIINELKSTL